MIIDYDDWKAFLKYAQSKSTKEDLDELEKDYEFYLKKRIKVNEVSLL